MDYYYVTAQVVVEAESYMDAEKIITNAIESFNHDAHVETVGVEALKLDIYEAPENA